MFWPVAVALTVAGPSVALTATAGKLGATSYADREAASRTLLAAAAHAIGPLEAARHSADPEVRRRASDLLDRLVVRQTWDATEVSVRAEKRPLNDVLDDLGRAVSVPIRYSQEASPVTVRLERVAFWQALDGVCRPAGLVARPTSNGRSITFETALTPSHVFYSGPFRMMLTSAAGSWEADLTGRRIPVRPNELIHLSATLDAEPKATVLSVGRSTITFAEDDAGQPLRPVIDRTSFYRPRCDRSHTQPYEIYLERLRRDGRSIRRLQGTVPVRVMTGARQELVVDLTAKPWGRPVRGRTAEITVNATYEDSGLIVVELEAKPIRSADDDLSTLPHRLALSSAGTDWPLVRVVNQHAVGDGLRFGVQFRPPAAGARPERLTLSEWLSATRDVPFEFKDIPLP